ncbi:hypothetical protein [Micromonospora sp. NPDC050495]|uniref:hypothetical protein n=1 Tax=Micromonospora sp. NPDC050495 TaxID=3154936 RepID=UPI0033E615C7
MFAILDRVQDGPPFRNGPASHERLEAGDQRSEFRPGSHARLVLGSDPVVLLVLRPIAMGGHIDGRDRETTFDHEAAGLGDHAGGLLVLATAVAHQDEGTGTGGIMRRPQHAGNLAEGEELFKDAVGRRL